MRIFVMRTSFVFDSGESNNPESMPTFFSIEKLTANDRKLALFHFIKELVSSERIHLDVAFSFCSIEVINFS